MPPKEVAAHHHELWLLKRPLHGLPETGEMLFETYSKNHRSNLRLRATAVDPAVLRHDTNGGLQSMTVTQVDNAMLTETAEFFADEQQG